MTIHSAMARAEVQLRFNILGAQVAHGHTRMLEEQEFHPLPEFE